MRPPSRTRGHDRRGGRRPPRLAVAALAVAVASVGAASVDEAGAGQPARRPTTAAPALRRVDPAELQALVERRIAELRVPGAVVVLRTPEGELTAAAGTTELGADSPPGTGTHFRIASNTKTMTSALVLQLAEEGKLALDDPISDHVADVPGGDHITIAELLEMRSGLYNYTDDPVVAETLDTDPAKVWTPRELLDIAFAHPPNFPPGSDYEYSNTNYALLGLVVEAAGGQPLGEAMHDRLFEPLGLHDTLLPASTSTSLPEPYAHGYLYGSSSVALYGEPEYTAETVAEVEAGTLRPTDYTGVNHSFATAAGGVVSTAADLATWMEALSGGDVLGPEYQEIWADSPRFATPDRPGYAYGYGIARQSWASNAITYHGGETAGYNSFMGVDTANDVTLVVWTNLTVSLDNATTAFAIGADVLDLLYVDPPPRAHPAVPAGTFEEAACPRPNIAGLPSLDFPAEVRCGYLTVPEDRDEPDGRTIRIFVARVPALSPTPEPDPIVMLSGGPGGAGSFEVGSGIQMGLNAERDVIYVDQRGTHHADPRLGCAAYDEFVNDAISVPFSAASTTAADALVVEGCGEDWADMGFDLASYDTAENAADIADLRVALGIEEWNVYGVSYGSKLALVVLRDHPEGIRSVVLDSVSPPNLNIVEHWWEAPASSFRAIFDACAAQPACAAAYPDLEEDFYDTVDRLEETPAVVEVQDASGVPLVVNIDGFQFVYAIVMASERGDASGVPEMITDMARGDAGDTVTAALSLLSPPEIIGLGGYGLAFGVFCREAANLTTEEATLARAQEVLPRFPEAVLRIQPKQGRLFSECPLLDVGEAAPSMMDPVVSDVPVLILEGSFDAATAPAWVEVVRPGLSQHQYVPFPFTGHAVLGKHECAVALMGAFLDRPGERVDAGCAAEVELTFVTG